MEADLQQRLSALEQKIDAMYGSVEKLRKYFLWTLIVTAVVILLPLVGLVFALPTFFSYYGNINSLVNTGGF